MITIEQLKDVKERTAALERYLDIENKLVQVEDCLLYTSPSPRDAHESRMPSSA